MIKSLFFLRTKCPRIPCKNSKFIVFTDELSINRQSYKQSHMNFTSEAFGGSHKEDSRRDDSHRGSRQNFRSSAIFNNIPILLSISYWVTIKDILGIEKVKLDKDPLKDMIKQSMLCRMYKRYDEAVNILHDALNSARESRNENHVTRVLNELANTYYDADDLEKAENLFKTVISRLIKFNGKNEMSPEFIGISLKLADIFARRGDLESAEAGYKHCVSKQMLVMEEHQKNHLLSKGANMEAIYPVEEGGQLYTDPIALFGMALEAYAHFLVDNFGEERMDEVEEFMDEVLKLSYHIYGPNSFHSANLLNVFASKCILRNRFEVAKKYLEIGILRIAQINECIPIVVSYYCNYAEALFHCGQMDEAINYAQRALKMARSQDSKIQRFAEDFYRHIERDGRRAMRNKNKVDGGGGMRSWLPF